MAAIRRGRGRWLSDFVTAMMALFIVLWLLSSSVKVQEAVGGYFRDPSGSSKRTGTGLAGSGENLLLNKQDMGKLKAELQSSIQKMTDLDTLKKNIEMTVTAEGLRIELLESEKGTFFDSGSSALNSSGRKCSRFWRRSWERFRTAFRRGPHGRQSFFRQEQLQQLGTVVGPANAARRLMQSAGLRGDQVSQVRGFAISGCAIPRTRWTHRTGGFQSSCSTSIRSATKRRRRAGRRIPPARARRKRSENR